MQILVISGSLNPGSYSRVLARAVEEMFRASGVEVSFVDLRDYPLPLCDGEAAYDHPDVEKLNGLIGAADAIIVGIPIYNFDVNAAVKNLVELTGSAWEGKIVAFLCAAGGRSSYMSVMGFANSLMLDFRCLIVPRFVYAVGGDFKEHPDGRVEITSADIRQRLQALCDHICRLAMGLSERTS